MMATSSGAPTCRSPGLPGLSANPTDATLFAKANCAAPAIDGPMLNRSSLTPIYPASPSDCLIQTDPLPKFDDIGAVALRTEDCDLVAAAKFHCGQSFSRLVIRSPRRRARAASVAL